LQTAPNAGNKAKSLINNGVPNPSVRSLISASTIQQALYLLLTLIELSAVAAAAGDWTNGRPFYSHSHATDKISAGDDAVHYSLLAEKAKCLSDNNITACCIRSQWLPFVSLRSCATPTGNFS